MQKNKVEHLSHNIYNDELKMHQRSKSESLSYKTLRTKQEKFLDLTKDSSI